jgi:ParB family transcriptional regulator, chromosome partitioning protein
MVRRNLGESVGNRGVSERLLVDVEHKPETMIDLSLIKTTFTFTPDKKALRHFYDQDKIRKWAESDLRKNGIHSSLWIRPHPYDRDVYELIAGMRRFTGATMIGLTPVPVKVFDWNDEEAYSAAMSENANREDFTALEELDHILVILASVLNLPSQEVVKLLYKLNNEDKGSIKASIESSQARASIMDVFDSYGQIAFKTFITSRLPLINLKSNILDSIRCGAINFSSAMEIAKVKDDDARSTLLSMAIGGNLSVAQVKGHVRKLSCSSEVVSSLSIVTSLKEINKSIRGRELSADTVSKISALIKKIEQEIEK